MDLNLPWSNNISKIEIFICFDCSGRHRSYGTHISFVRSVKLDKFNRKQLKMMELSGNKAAKEYFGRVGIPKIGEFYDYSHEKVTKYKNEIANKVKESFSAFSTEIESKPVERKEINNEELFNKMSQMKVDEVEEKQSKIS